MPSEASSKPLVWMGSCRKDFSAFPEDVKAEVGYGLFLAQCGGRHRKAKVLSGFGGAGVVEVVSDFRGDTYRTVYTVRFPTAIYVLHAFQKKSKSGIATPRHEIALIEQRLRDAESLQKENGS